MNVVAIPIIMVISYAIVELVKVSFKNDKVNSFLPLISGVLGMVLGVVAFYVAPEIMVTGNAFSALLIGLCSGLSATGSNELVKQIIDFKKSMTIFSDAIEEDPIDLESSVDKSDDQAEGKTQDNSTESTEQ